MRMLFCVCLILISGASFAETVTVSGTIIDQRTNTALPGAEVGLYELVGIWKFWTLPENRLLDSAITDEQGAFHLRGKASTFYMVRSRFGGCWLPFAENFDVRDDGSKVEGLVITTEPNVGLCKEVKSPTE